MYKVTGGDGREYGPITAEQVRQWLSEGRLNAGSRVQAEGGEWKTLAQFPEFAPLLASPPPTPGTIQATGGYLGVPPRTSALAITSLVMGILGLFTCGLSGIVGLILGVVALTKIKKSNGQLGGSGLAIAGISTSGAFLLLLPVFAGLMLPALARAKMKAQQAACMNHGKMLGLAMRMYADDHTNTLPTAATWCDAIQNDVGNPTVFQCPTEPGQRCAYAFNPSLSGRNIDRVNPRTVVLFESDAGWNGVGSLSNVPSSRHRLGTQPAIVVVYVDGSVRVVPISQLAFERWQP